MTSFQWQVWPYGSRVTGLPYGSRVASGQSAEASSAASFAASVTSGVSGTLLSGAAPGMEDMLRTGLIGGSGVVNGSIFNGWFRFQPFALHHSPSALTGEGCDCRGTNDTSVFCNFPQGVPAGMPLQGRLRLGKGSASDMDMVDCQTDGGFYSGSRLTTAIYMRNNPTNWTQTDPNWLQTDPEPIRTDPELILNWPRLTPNWPRADLKLIPNFAKNR